MGDYIQNQSMLKITEDMSSQKQYTGESGSPFFSKAKHKANTDYSFRNIGKSDGEKRHRHRQRKH